MGREQSIGGHRRRKGCEEVTKGRGGGKDEG